ncbi:hypothetical protein DAPPUDRAFT_299535 [Daphnia pulex]|uniref:Uncharacterized protein n=1 Tax=Daphnia pulex TaxID=6669 RepID=E9GP08_DAPPU|nr:hypothetical protein DAPPUDRAFT_299535 [Daphnia pulex]|eukprot:EFX78850.1 hypothetical protein DAPPUDRAFT_299535 [Daphnia pulex]
MVNAREFEAKSTVCLVPISKINLVYPSVLIGHDENYIVVHRSDPSRFEIISTSSLNLTRTIDAFDNCSSVQHKDGLIVSTPTFTRTCCIIRIWDAETGLCLREIQEPDPTRYHNLNHLVGFTSNYLITVPANLSMLKKRVIKIRDLSVAIDLHSNQTSASTDVLATLELVRIPRGTIVSWLTISSSFIFMIKNLSCTVLLHKFNEWIAAFLKYPSNVTVGVP